MIEDKIDNEVKNTDERVITDVDLGFEEKRCFRINGDDKRRIELNISDLNVIRRLNEVYPRLRNSVLDAQKALAEINDDTESDDLSKLSKVLEDIDKKMRDDIDYLFAPGASKACAPTGNMYDPINGRFRFDYIIEKLSALYTTGLTAEFKKMKNNVEKKTIKYTKKYHK